MLIPVEYTNLESFKDNTDLSFTEMDIQEIIIYCSIINKYYCMNAIWFKDSGRLVFAIEEKEENNNVCFSILSNELINFIEKWEYIKRDNENDIINRNEIFNTLFLMKEVFNIGL
jgi:hypothetical protein